MIRRFITLCNLAALLPGVAMAAEFSLPMVSLRPHLDAVRSIDETRFARVVRQQLDYSCGSASIATLLQYHYGRNVDEAEVIKRMVATGDRTKIEKQGFSLLDMKLYLQTLGLQAEGYKAPLAKLDKVGVPAVALVNINKYLHFVVVKGLDERSVLLGDPTLGLRIMSRYEFEKAWNGILFVVTNETTNGRKRFNMREDWELARKSPLATAAAREGIGSFTIYSTRTPNYY